MADLFIRQTFFRQTLENSRFAKHSACQTFPLYGTQFIVIEQSTNKQVIGTNSVLLKLTTCKL